MASLRLTRRTAWLLGVSIALGVAPAEGGEPSPPEFKVIVHPERPAELHRAFLADAFLKNVSRWSDDEAIRPVEDRMDHGRPPVDAPAVLVVAVQRDPRGVGEAAELRHLPR